MHRVQRTGVLPQVNPHKVIQWWADQQAQQPHVNNPSAYARRLRANNTTPETITKINEITAQFPRAPIPTVAMAVLEGDSRTLAYYRED